MPPILKSCPREGDIAVLERVSGRSASHLLPLEVVGGLGQSPESDRVVRDGRQHLHRPSWCAPNPSIALIAT